MTQQNNRMMLLQRRKRIWQVILTVLAILTFVGLIAARKRADYRNSLEEQESHRDDHVATLAVVGDIGITDDLVADALQEDGTYNFLPYFMNAAADLYAADLTIGNLELTFSGAGYPYGSEYANAPDELASTLKMLGFDLVQTANSKTIAAGVAGMERTIETLKENDILPLGSHTSQKDYDENDVVVVEVNGIKIAFIAFTKGFDGMSIPEDRSYYANLLYQDYETSYKKINTSGIKSAVSRATSAGADIVIAMVHWGSAYKLSVSETQEEITELMLENGIDVILGSHSHVVGPMRYESLEIDGVGVKRFVAYSLGSFMNTDTTAYVRDSVILNLVISKDDETGETIIKSQEYIPYYIYDCGDGNELDRFRILKTSEALQLYDTYGARLYGSVDASGYDKLKANLTNLKTNTESDFQRPIPGYDEEEVDETTADENTEE